MPFFGVCRLWDPLIDFHKNWHSWLHRGPHPTCMNWDHLVQRGRVCACVKLSPSGVYFFDFMRIATGRPVGPIVVVNGSNDGSSWPLRPFYGFINMENIFPYFVPKKMWKIALCPMANSKGYNSGTVKDRRELFSPSRGFSGSRNRMASFEFTPDWLLLPWQPIVVISTQNWP